MNKILVIFLILANFLESRICFADVTVQDLSANLFSPSKIEFLTNVSFNKNHKVVKLNSGCRLDYIYSWTYDSTSFKKGGKYRATYIDIDERNLYIHFESFLKNPYEFVLICFKDQIGRSPEQLPLKVLNEQYLDGKMKLIP